MDIYLVERVPFRREILHHHGRKLFSHTQRYFAVPVSRSAFLLSRMDQCLGVMASQICLQFVIMIFVFLPLRAPTRAIIASRSAPVPARSFVVNSFACTSVKPCTAPSRNPHQPLTSRYEGARTAGDAPPPPPP